MDRGYYKGEPFTRIPLGYLKRLAMNESDPWHETARRELERRGTPFFDNPIHISNHAIDRFSQYCLETWIQRRKDNEGLFTFLVRAGAEAIAWDNRDPRGRYVHLGIRWVFDFRPEVPILVTVMKIGERNRD